MHYKTNHNKEKNNKTTQEPRNRQRGIEITEGGKKFDWWVYTERDAEEKLWKGKQSGE